MDALRELWGRKGVRGGAVVVAVLAILLIFAFCRGESVPAARAVRKPVVETLVINGRVLARSKAEIGSVQTGRVRSVLVEEGDRVVAGQLLVQLDDAEAAAAVAEARGRLAQSEAKLEQLRETTAPVGSETLRQARARLENAERNWERMRELHAGGIASKADLDAAAENVKIARSAVEAAGLEDSSSRGPDARIARAAVVEARGAVDAAVTRLAQTKITAPAPGRILARSAEPGTVVRAGDRLITMSIDTETQLIAQPDEKNLRSLRVGQKARVSADAYPDRQFEAVIIYVAPSIDVQRGTVDVRLRVANPPDYLKTDMTLSIEIETGRKASALVIPTEAVRDTSRPRVLIAERGRVNEKEVTVGIRGDGLAEIVSGLEEGDIVLLPGERQFAPGDRVRPRIQRGP
ncbi:MAG: efflux RND transporter periplasmic adaptor subunit [Thermoanaerobaculia bacterium]